jgi:putative transposase
VTDFLQNHPNGQVIACDEMSLYLQATTTQVWSPVGQTPQVWVSGSREHVHLYGAVNLRTGQAVALPTQGLSSEQTVHFLQKVLQTYPEQPLFMLWDRAPWHRGKEVQALLAAHPRVTTLFFPPACPELNPQEHVWSQARAKISHQHGYRDLRSLTQAFVDFLNTTCFSFCWLEKYAPPILFKT